MGSCPTTTGGELMSMRYRLSRALRWHPVMRAEVEEIVDLRARQAEGLISLTSFLPLRAPLPPMGGFPMGADLGIELVSRIISSRPKLVVELGAGVSTLLAAYSLEKIGGGRLVSIEHDPDWVGITRERLALHGFPSDTVEVEVRHAPLVPREVDGMSFRWYSEEALGDLEGIDLMVVDGPPNSTGDLARYPALPLMSPRFSPSCVLVIDDTGRHPGTEVVRRWSERWRGSLELYDLPVSGGGMAGTWSAN